MKLKNEFKRLAKIILTPSVLISSGFGFMSGTFYMAWAVTAGFDTGSIPDWIGASATVFAGLWAYFTFRKTDVESRDATLEVTLSDRSTSEGIENGFDKIKSREMIVDIRNKITRPAVVKFVYLQVSLEENPSNNGIKDIYIINDNDKTSGNTRLEFEDTLSISFSYNAMFRRLAAFGNSYVITPHIILSDNSDIEFKESKRTLSWDELEKGHTYDPYYGI